MKDSGNRENLGVAFVSFKDKDCVNDTIEEFDLVKTKLVGKEHYDILDIQNWEVEVAYPTSDIVWSDLNKGKGRILPVKVLLNLVPLIVSGLVALALVMLDEHMKVLPSFA